jgi:hypothetical protein
VVAAEVAVAAEDVGNIFFCEKYIGKKFFAKVWGMCTPLGCEKRTFWSKKYQKRGGISIPPAPPY